jgi:Raf kinase inhibitor-like YbhB/YbcL family protein
MSACSRRHRSGSVARSSIARKSQLSVPLAIARRAGRLPEWRSPAARGAGAFSTGEYVQAPCALPRRSRLDIPFAMLLALTACSEQASSALPGGATGAAASGGAGTTDPQAPIEGSFAPGAGSRSSTGPAPAGAAAGAGASPSAGGTAAPAGAGAPAAPNTAGAPAAGSGGRSAGAGASGAAATGGALTLIATGAPMLSGGFVAFPPTAIPPTNQSPGFSWTGVPAEAKSLALVFRDVSSSTPPVKWVLWDIPPSVSEIPADVSGSSPNPMEVPGASQLGSLGNQGYAGPCCEENMYEWILYALDVEKLPGTQGMSTAQINMNVIPAHDIAKSKAVMMRIMP